MMAERNPFSPLVKAHLGIFGPGFACFHDSFVANNEKDHYPVQRPTRVGSSS